MGAAGLWVGRGEALLAAAPRATPTPAPLGRANPFKPLIAEDPPGPGAPDGVPGAPPALPPGPPGLPAVPPGLPAVPPAPPKPTAEPIAFLAIAFDADPGGSENPVAAVRVEGRTRFVRLGDAVDGGTVVGITSYELMLRSPAGAMRLIPRAKR